MAIVFIAGAFIASATTGPHSCFLFVNDTGQTLESLLAEAPLNDPFFVFCLPDNDGISDCVFDGGNVHLLINGEVLVEGGFAMDEINASHPLS